MSILIYPLTRSSRQSQLSPEAELIIADIVKYYARKLCANWHDRAVDASDLHQHLWLVVLRKLHRFNPGLGSLSNFARIVLRDAVRDIRRQRARVRFVDRVDDHEPRYHDDAPDQVDRRLDLATVLERIPEPDRSTFTLVGALGIGGAAMATGLPRSTLRHRLTRYRADFEQAGVRGYLPQ